MRTQTERIMKGAQFARGDLGEARASNEELLQLGIATRQGPTAGRLVEIGAQTGLLYVVQTAPAAPVKVGYSTRSGLRGRVAELQTGNPYRLTVIAQAPAYLSHEQRAHKTLKNDRLLGEWFNWSPRVAAFVKALKADGVEAALAAAKIAKDRPA